MPENGPTIFAAGLLLPVSAPPIREGAVLVRDGRIEAVGTLDELSRGSPNAELRYFPYYTVVPGAVNAHAHLGFRRGDAPEGGSFSVWLAGLIERLPEKESWTAEAARASAREAIEAGTTFMAESSPYGECLPQLAEAGLAGTVYAEVFPHEIGTPGGAVGFIIHKGRSLRGGLPQRVAAPGSVHPISRVLRAARREDSGSTVYGECTLTLAFTRSGKPSPSSRAFATMNSTAPSGVPISCGKNSA